MAFFIDWTQKQGLPTSTIRRVESQSFCQFYVNTHLAILAEIAKNLLYVSDGLRERFRALSIKRRKNLTEAIAMSNKAYSR